MKKIILAGLLIFTALPLFADDVNMTPQNTFSGYTNNGARSQYPRLTRSVSAADVIEERNEIMKAKSVKQMRDVNPSYSPMTYSQFPQNYDSSNPLRTQDVRNTMQNMLFGL